MNIEALTYPSNLVAAHLDVFTTTTKGEQERTPNAWGVLYLPAKQPLQSCHGKNFRFP